METSKPSVYTFEQAGIHTGSPTFRTAKMPVSHRQTSSGPGLAFPLKVIPSVGAGPSPTSSAPRKDEKDTSLGSRARVQWSSLPFHRVKQKI